MPRKVTKERRPERPERAVRRRRSPEVARAELVDAAERLYARQSPEAVGLKDVAREAGTSHGLITHYFGTYDGLVAAVLEQRTTALREQIVAVLADPEALTRPEVMVDILFTAYQDPVHMRLAKYLVAGERPGMVHAFALQHKGIAQVAARIAERLDPDKPAAEISDEYRSEISVALMLTVAAAFGYAATRHSLAGAIGAPLTPALDRHVRKVLAEMVRAYILSARAAASAATIEG